MTGSVDLSIVVEWENPRFAGVARGRAVLQSLGRQVCAYRESTAAAVEILLVFDPECASEGCLRGLVADSLPAAADLRLIPVPDAGYYQLKNVAVNAARYPAVVMLDSDTIPEAGWLAAMADAISAEGVDVVGGATTVARDTAFARAVARFWFFPRCPPAPGPLRREDGFWANNVAFRRHVFVRFGGFPDAPLFRGQCRMLADRLRTAGETIWLAPSARTVHPPPRGILALVVRAWRHGHDTVAMPGAGVAERAWRASIRRARASWSTVGCALAAEAKEAGIPCPERLFTGVLAAIYFGCKFAGERWAVRPLRAGHQQANS